MCRRGAGGGWQGVGVGVAQGEDLLSADARAAIASRSHIIPETKLRLRNILWGEASFYHGFDPKEQPMSYSTK